MINPCVHVYYTFIYTNVKELISLRKNRKLGMILILNLHNSFVKRPIDKDFQNVGTKYVKKGHDHDFSQLQNLLFEML